MEAARILEAIVKKYPKEAPLWWYLGGIYVYDLKKPRKAIPAFRQAVQLTPKSERASLGLFHSLWDANRISEALAEIKRFQTLTHWTCQDYLEIIDELTEKWLEAPSPKKKVHSRR